MLKFGWKLCRFRRKRVYLEAAVRSLPDPVFVLDRRGTYLDVFGGTERTLYDDASALVGKTLHDVVPAPQADHYLSVINRTLDTGVMQVVEYCLSADEVKNSPKDGPSGEQWFQGRIHPLRQVGHGLGCVVWTVINITEKHQAALERDQALADIENALLELHTLQGILPICSSCKKIRDERGHWHILETYISNHSGADFSHGICPDCMKTLYPECSTA